ncbi:MAG: outer membrane protein assembly factor BamA [Candidatus Omnitrophica bacterium CG11_big_fil_rev_8_21_14_0_20_64_10]|nr:MAG: outer membrane protein assembly factor BamA [Candidatus Omnitrophica bacterium CG11_big_fil_rev_8_21_14_0_20_64_10]
MQYANPLRTSRLFRFFAGAALVSTVFFSASTAWAEEQTASSDSRPVAESAAPAASQETVVAVEVEGNAIVATTTILTRIRTRPGDAFNNDTVNEDIKRLYGTGFFADVTADIRPYREGKMVRFIVKERPVIGSIIITGARHFRESKLKETMKLKEQELLDRRTLKEDIEQIRQLYRTKGFYLVDITHEVKLDDLANKVSLYINIDEHAKIKVRRIRFTGNQQLRDKQLLKGMATKQAWWWFSSGYYRPEVLEEDLERVKGLYRLEGYPDVQATSKVSFDEDRRFLVIDIAIEEGPRYLVGQTTLRGVSVLPEEDLRAALALKTEDPFSEDRMRQDSAAMQSVYFGRGYMTASVYSDTAVNPATGRVDITHKVSEGSLSYVGKISIEGNIKTRDSVVRRELRLYPGDRFDGQKLRKSKERLYNLGYFEEVSLETAATDRPDQRDLKVGVKESKTGEFAFGGGFSSVDNFIGFAEITQRNFDLFNWPSFVGGGQELRFRTLLGTRRTDFELSFTEPWLFDRPYLFGFDLFNTVRTRGEGYSFELKRQGGVLRLGKTLSDENKLLFRYRLESDRVTDVSNNASQALKDEIGENSISSVGLTFTRDARNNVFNPNTGYLAATGVELAGTALGGDRDFWKWTASDSVYFHPIREDHVLELSARFGIADNYGDSETVPIFERFFAGGADSVRGYKERRVGPTDPNSNDPVGGEALAVFNAEYTVPIVDFLKGAAFVDAGNVWSSAGEMFQDELRIGVGAGVRVKTPFGPVKLDYGWPINPADNEKDTGRLHFSASRAF